MARHDEVDSAGLVGEVKGNRARAGPRLQQELRYYMTPDRWWRVSLMNAKIERAGFIGVS